MTRVLVVEDEESFSDALSYMLRREGYDTVVAATGTDALAEFDRAGADIVLLDLMLPGLSGTEVCRSLRARSSVPIIMLTAKDAEIAVTDNGIGIPRTDRTRVFERFYRVDQSRASSTGGTGLGLAIVKHVASNHGGSVTVWSEEGLGSTFTLRVPLERDADTDDVPGGRS